MRLRFGRCLFDASARELRRDGVPQPLSPEAFDLRELLVEGARAVIEDLGSVRSSAGMSTTETGTAS